MFQEIVDQSQIAVVISDYDTRTIIYANDSVRQILEIPQRVELIGQPTAVLYSQGESLISREELSEFNAESFWERDIYTTKGKYLKLKGREVLWANRHTYAIYIIDETKEQELIHNVPGGLTIMELNVSGSCKVTFANNSWLKMMDTTWQVFERVYARDYFGWIHPKDRDMVKREIITNWGKSKISVEPFRVKTTRGQIIYLTANLTLRNIDGSNAQYYCVFTDITSQIAARRVLEEAQKRLNIIQSNSNLLIWEIDFQRNVLIPDRHSARVFHTTKQEYPYPEIIRDVDAFDSKTKTEILDFIHSFQKGEEVDNLEILIRTAKGEYIWVLLRGAAMEMEDGRVTQGLLWCRDITDRKRMENIYINRISRSLNISDKTEVAFVFDLTDNRIIESSSNNYEMFPRLHQMKVDEYLKAVCDAAENREELETQLNIEVMTEAYRVGTPEER